MKRTPPAPDKRSDGPDAAQVRSELRERTARLTALLERLASLERSADEKDREATAA